jgi:hypothetical protein
MTATSPTHSDRPLVDVRDMIVVHTAMLREFRLAAAAVRPECTAALRLLVPRIAPWFYARRARQVHGAARP